MIFHDMYLIETNESILEETLEKTNLKGNLEIDFQTARLTFDSDLYHLEIECDAIETAETDGIITAFEIEKVYIFSSEKPVFVPEIIKEENHERY